MIKRIFILLLQLTPLLIFAQNPISVEEFKKFNSVLHAINSFYVDSINGSKVVENAIISTLKELDPHSAYISKEEAKQAQEPLEGSFDGIGVQFDILEDTLLVVQTIEGGPSERVGLLPGDRILYIDNDNIAGVKIKNRDVIKRLRGPKGSEVEIRVLRRGLKEELFFKIIRDKIPLYTVDASYMLSPSIGYIKINNFGGTTLAEYEKAFQTLKKKGMNSLILDLQGNGGGYLGAAIGLSNHFLSKGQLIVYTQGLHQAKRDALASHLGNFTQGRLVVLIDEFSASASEIVAGAIQDWDRGVLVGRRTFGKGLVQSQLELGDGSLLRLTTARYYTPTGRSIQKPYKNGIKYEEDLLNRYNNGEFSHIDSIHFPDSLKYHTLNKNRPVYAGGGIMADVFVPLDTTKYSSYHRNLAARGAINKTIAQFLDQNRKVLLQKYKTFDDYKTSFIVDAKLLQTLIKNGEKEKLEYNEEEFEKSKSRIMRQIKAFIARDVWESQYYHQIMGEDNESILRAIEILGTEGEYEKILQ